MFVSHKIRMLTNGISEHQPHSKFIGIHDLKSYLWELQMRGRYCDIIEHVFIPRILFSSYCVVTCHMIILPSPHCHYVCVCVTDITNMMSFCAYKYSYF